MLQAYDDFKADAEIRSKGRVWMWSVSRQFGKSYSLVVLALEECLRRPGAQVKYASVDGKMCRAIVFPAIEKLLASCPEDLRPQFRMQDGLFYFPNGSRLTVAGVDKDSIKKLRGQTAHLCLVDEGGFMGNLQQVIQEVLLPQLTTTKGRLIMASTPPDSAGHFASELYQTCKSRGASATFTIWDNQLLGPQEKQEIVREYGGVESTRFRREYLTEFVTDVSNAVVPEFTQEAEREMLATLPRPEHFDAYVALDGGFSDPAAALFAYVDHARARLVIEDEWFQKGAITGDIARAIGDKETELWGETPLLMPDRIKELRKIPSRLVRVMDHDPAMAEEFSKQHGQLWRPAQKRDLMANVNRLNQWIRDRMIEIKPNCKVLIRQLHNATFAGQKQADGTTGRRTFTRNATDGHFDGVAALLYMLPEVDLFHISGPPNSTPLNVWKNPLDEDEDADEDRALINAFPRFKL